MKLYTESELRFLNEYWENVQSRKHNDRSYEFSILVNDEWGIITKLLDWFEKETGEKLKHKEHDLVIHKYNVGDYFQKHTDKNYKNRAWVVGFHINDEYEGGDYILYNPDGVIDKTVGIPYCFKSDRVHEITKITKGVRKSGLIFIDYEDLVKRNLL
jgi:predicted 2-oxoglutarate/Fe(II)-dependent dioxygenase YbiX